MKSILQRSDRTPFYRWKVDHGKIWEHLSGEIFGQTQISYCNSHTIFNDAPYSMTFNHPLDMHFAAAGLQVINLA